MSTQARNGSVEAARYRPKHPPHHKLASEEILRCYWQQRPGEEGWCQDRPKFQGEDERTACSISQRTRVRGSPNFWSWGADSERQGCRGARKATNEQEDQGGYGGSRRPLNRSGVVIIVAVSTFHVRLGSPCTTPAMLRYHFVATAIPHLSFCRNGNQHYMLLVEHSGSCFHGPWR
jgi:hypothetical protein